MAFSGYLPWSRWVHIALAVYIKPKWAQYFGFDVTEWDGQSQLLLMRDESSVLSWCETGEYLTTGVHTRTVNAIMAPWVDRIYLLQRHPVYWLTMKDQRNLAYAVLDRLGQHTELDSPSTWAVTSALQESKVGPGGLRPGFMTPRNVIKRAVESKMYNKPIRIK